MNILFIHQNFPGQFKQLAPALAERGDRVLALTPRNLDTDLWNGVEIHSYAYKSSSTKGVHTLASGFETKMIRADSCYDGALRLKASGFSPDVIIAHGGWGEALFLKDVWPEARIGLYCELYHLNHPKFRNFDPEFSQKPAINEDIRLRVQNLHNEMQFEISEAGLSPTKFQASTFPRRMRDKITVIHEGVDTAHLKPNPAAKFLLENGANLSMDDEVISFINRNLEPYRGYHRFMRALPELLKNRPHAQVVLIGGEGASYGGAPPRNQTWKQIFIDEVRGQISDQDWSRVHFMGRVPYNQFMALMQITKAHVYLTYPFVLSWSTLEAMSMGAPIIASDTAPVQEVIKHNKTGLVVDFFDQNKLIEAIHEVLDSPKLRAKLGQAARQKIIKEYDLKTNCLPKQIKWVEDLAKLPVLPVDSHLDDLKP